LSDGNRQPARCVYQPSSAARLAGVGEVGVKSVGVFEPGGDYYTTCTIHISVPPILVALDEKVAVYCTLLDWLGAHDRSLLLAAIAGSQRSNQQRTPKQRKNA
jgi:hypothetical protein